MTRMLISILSAVSLAATLPATELHVATTGTDSNPGTQAAPLRSIQRAAELAHPGDVITVHEGTYRERVNPPRGGESDARRIVYQAAAGEHVEVKGSEVVKNWEQVQNDAWKVTLPASFFGSFNPYADVIRGDWFVGKGRDHHTGAVYLNGEWLIEAAGLDEVLQPAAATSATTPENVDSAPRWFARVDQDATTIWAQFKGVNPNEQLVEINVRRAVFYPEKPGCNFITVRGFALRHAATPWAPPTAEQVGLIGTHWSRGWVIENNVVSHSVCSGIALGKHGDEFDNTSANTAEGYVKTIERAHAHAIPWTKQNIGHHVVRKNTISHCEQAGIVGSLGCAFSTVTDNVIHDIHVRRLFTGAEMAGIKFHAAIDVQLARNHIFRTTRGLWLDWMAQGTRVSQNLFHENLSEDLFVEVNHGPFLVDNNVFLSATALLDMSEGGAYVHNLLTGKIVSTVELNRQTPYHPAHSTTVAGLANIRGGDNRFYNNLFVGDGSSSVESPAKQDAHRRVAGYGLWVYDTREFPLSASGNVYCRGARPSAKETDFIVVEDANPEVSLTDGCLQLTANPDAWRTKATVVTTALLGKARIAGLPYEKADGSPLTVDVDYLGKPRSFDRPLPGPFENPGTGRIKLDVAQSHSSD